MWQRGGLFHKSWEVSKVIPVPKRGSKKDVNNYRPIALASNLGKVVESAVQRQLSSHLDKLLPDSMFGFRKNRGTSDALISVLDKIKGKLNSGQKVAVVALDASAAFDVLNHRLVLQSLEILGAGPTLLKWLNDYFQDRFSFVDINGCRSTPWEVDVGAIQGGLISPD